MISLVKKTPLADRPQVLYRFWNCEDVLLYVGITADPGKRWKDHSKDKGWWSEVVRVTVEHFPDRASVEAAERLAIATEMPLHNVALASPARDPGAEDGIRAIRIRYDEAVAAAHAERDEMIRAALADGYKQTDVVRLTGYTREAVRQAADPAARDRARQAAADRRAAKRAS